MQFRKLYEKGKRILRCCLQKYAERKKQSDSERIRLEKELETARKLIDGSDREHIWAFFAGDSSQDFRGNPKYLFVYICRYRTDIKAYWLCSNTETISLIKNAGFPVFSEAEPAGQYLIDHTGVAVAEQAKYILPPGYDNVKYINLWHGIGFKKVERSRLMDSGISLDLAKKYVRNNAFFRTNEMMTASCPDMEPELAEDLGLELDRVIRTGYPRNLYQQNFEPVSTFDHDIKKRKGLSADAKIIVYAPTFRPYAGVFAQAVPDPERLHRFCREHNWLFIFKMHPKMEQDIGFLEARKTYGESSNFLFWDNKDDFYEIMHMTDLAIYDYSSIFSDMLQMGVRHFVRYLYDFDRYMSQVDVHDSYFQRTAGIIAHSWDELFEVMERFEERDESEELDLINRRLWAYSHGKDDFEHIIEEIFRFRPEKMEFKTLISFDIFDTLISRDILNPFGIFVRVEEKIRESEEDFPAVLEMRYLEVRHLAELNVRESKQKSIFGRQSGNIEVTLDEILERIKGLYSLTERQTSLLKSWEVDAEIESVIPLKGQIELLKKLKSDPDNDIVLISDMYLPKEVVQKMLRKADPILAEIPLFLSCEYGVMKMTQQLYMEVYKSCYPSYNYKKWIHYGDNINADQTNARRFEIETRHVEKPEFNDVQDMIAEYCRSYDGYLVAALQARMCKEYSGYVNEMVISVISLCFVTYIDWVLRDAQKRGYKKLYFVMRDGYHLKRIADAIKDERGLDISTHLLYASRKTWQVPSYIDEIDSEFWDMYCGAFDNVASEEKLYTALCVNKENFKKFFPQVDPQTIDYANRKEIEGIVEIFKNSDKYRNYLVGYAKGKRFLAEGYLHQEMVPDEPWAIVEYYGRGYTQDCFGRLYADAFSIDKESFQNPFYYSRTIFPSDGANIRYNFTSNNVDQHWIEAIFANMPIRSVEDYEVVDDRICPVIRPCNYNSELFGSMEKLLPAFAREYAKLKLGDPETTDKLLLDVAFAYFSENRTNEKFAEFIGGLTDSVALYGKKRDFAPPYTMDDLDRLQNKTVTRGSMSLTTSITMSYVRSDEPVKKRYEQMYQILPGDDPTKGSLLSEKEQKANEEYKKKYFEIREKAEIFRQKYEEAVNQSEIIKNEILLVSNGKANTFLRDAVSKAFADSKDISVQPLEIYEDMSIDEAVRVIAGAEFIITVNTIGLFALTKWRPETNQILLKDTAFILYNKGFKLSYNLKWRQKYMTFIQTNDIAAVQTPGSGCSRQFKEFYLSNNDGENCTIPGSCITDIYFNETIREKALARIDNFFPEGKGKKKILYMPSLRYRNGTDFWLEMLDLDILKDEIGDDYAVMVHINPEQKKTLNGPYYNVINIPGFSREIKLQGGFSLREAMIAADVIVGDYRDTFFEAALLHKPVYSTAWDYEKVCRSGNMSYNAGRFESFLFCPVVKSSRELARELKKTDEYDYSRMDAFRNDMMGECDGCSARKLVDYILNRR